MKQVLFKKVIFVTAVLALVTTLSFQQTPGYTITGDIKGLPDGTGIELLPSATHKNEKPVAVTTVKGGKFVFTGAAGGPRLFFVKIAGDDYGGFQLMVDNTAIHVSGVTKAFAENGRRNHEFTEIKVTGSKVHDEYLAKTSLRSRLDKLYTAYNNNNKDIFDQVQEANNNKDTVLYNQLVASDAYKKFERDEKAFFDTVEVSIRKLILANKDTWWGPFLMLDQYSYFTPEQKELFDQLSQKAKDSYYGKVVAAELYPPSHVGRKAPSLAFVDQQQQQVSFASMAKGKRYVIIDFWASWCGPCRKAVPALKNYYEEIAGKGVEIISVSIDKKEADWVKANNEEKFPWHSFLDRQGLADAYNVKAIPAMFLLDGEGKVLAENLMLDSLKARIK